MKFVKKPDTLDAIQWSGSNWHAVREFAEQHGDINAVFVNGGSELFVRTVTGDVKVDPDCWVVFRNSFAGFEVATHEALHAQWEEAAE